MSTNYFYSRYLVRDEVSLTDLSEELCEGNWKFTVSVRLKLGSKVIEICRQATAAKKRVAKNEAFGLIIKAIEETGYTPETVSKS